MILLLMTKCSKSYNTIQQGLFQYLFIYRDMKYQQINFVNSKKKRGNSLENRHITES